MHATHHLHGDAGKRHCTMRCELNASSCECRSAAFVDDLHHSYTSRSINRHLMYHTHSSATTHLTVCTAANEAAKKPQMRM